MFQQLQHEIIGVSVLTSEVLSGQIIDLSRRELTITNYITHGYTSWNSTMLSYISYKQKNPNKILYVYRSEYGIEIEKKPLHGRDRIRKGEDLKYDLENRYISSEGYGCLMSREEIVSKIKEYPISSLTEDTTTNNIVTQFMVRIPLTTSDHLLNRSILIYRCLDVYDKVLHYEPKICLIQ